MAGWGEIALAGETSHSSVQEVTPVGLQVERKATVSA